MPNPNSDRKESTGDILGAYKDENKTNVPAKRHTVPSN